MYCGDETGALVIDVGAQNARFGYAGDDLPKIVFNTATGVTYENTVGASSSAVASSSTKRRFHVGQSARIPRPGMEVKVPFDCGLVEDFDMLGHIWEHGVNELRSDPREHPLIIVEPSHLFRNHREKVLTMAFEQQGAPAVYLANAPVMQAFSTGRASAMVIDVGASGSRVVGVYDGHVLKQGTVISEVGGTALSLCLQDSIYRQSPGLEITPRCLLKKTQRPAGSAAAGAGAGAGAGAESSAMDVDGAGAGASSSSGAAAAGSSAPSTSSSSTKPIWDVIRHPQYKLMTESFRATWALEVIDDLKRTHCSVTDIGYGEDKAEPPLKEQKYELPDGTMLRIKNPLQLVPELLFRPARYASEFSHTLQKLCGNAWHMLYSQDIVKREQPYVAYSPSLQQMLYSSLLACPVEIRRDLCHHIVLTGGGSLLTGMQERLKWETMALVPQAFKPRIVASSPLEREYGSWIGASILASLGTFQQMWISKRDFEEKGAANTLEEHNM